MSEEQWLPVVGLEGQYEVSDRGRIKGLARTIARRLGRGTNPNAEYFCQWRERIRAPYVTEDGYHQYKLGHLGSVYVHVLVLGAFVGPCPEGEEARHLDGMPGNNALANLCWGTPKANADDRTRHGRTPRGVDQHLARLTPIDVVAIRNEIGDRPFVERGKH